MMTKVQPSAIYGNTRASELILYNLLVLFDYADNTFFLTTADHNIVDSLRTKASRKASDLFNFRKKCLA